VDPGEWLAFEQRKHTQLLATDAAGWDKEPVATAAGWDKEIA
jgi:hypothetical protein